MEYVLSTENLTKQYKDFKALDPSDHACGKRSYLRLRRKKRSGEKTTLIRLICGLQSPTSGEYPFTEKVHIRGYPADAPQNGERWLKIHPFISI